MASFLKENIKYMQPPAAFIEARYEQRCLPGLIGFSYGINAISSSHRAKSFKKR